MVTLTVPAEMRRVFLHYPTEMVPVFFVSCRCKHAKDKCRDSGAREVGRPFANYAATSKRSSIARSVRHRYQAANRTFDRTTARIVMVVAGHPENHTIGRTKNVKRTANGDFTLRRHSS
jgi:hypothetical protein